MNKKTSLLAAAALGTTCLVWKALQSRSWLDLRGSLVLITGGSRGLGLQLAREFGSKGAVVVICARDPEELSQARLDLQSRGIGVHHFICDVTNESQVKDMVREVNERLGPIDVLVNNAGLIRVGPVSNMSIDDFKDAMNVNFWGVLHSAFAVLPSMRERHQGCIVNITSVGGKISVPHLLPYSCAKFAAVALSEGLRSELAPHGIHVTTIVPGLMRTGSHLNAEFKGRQRAEYTWFGAGAATPFISIGAERAARAIVRATVQRDGEKILSVPADLVTRMRDAFPEASGAVLSLVNRLLPSSPSVGATGLRSGAEIEPELTSAFWKFLTRPGQKAAESLNQI